MQILDSYRQSKPQALKQTITVQSPGRINIIGDHTDYNEGFVLPAAIDKKTTVKIHKNNQQTVCNVTAENVDETFRFDLKDYQSNQNGWQNYVMGVVNEMEKRNAKLEGFDATFSGDVPIGSGLSSSAALECAFAFALNELFDCGLDKWELIKASQMAEHHFVGIRCGIMDQFASMMGRKNQVMLLDCRTLEFEYFPLDLGKYELLLLNTNVTHALTDSVYNERRGQCEEGVAIIQDIYPDIKTLRDVNFSILTRFSKSLPPLIFKRCMHVVSENHRVLEATEAIKSNNITLLGQLLDASHNSLRDDYEVSCSELDFLVEKSKRHPEILGSRMMGGGFGGCTINIVKKDFTETFIEKISKDYQSKFGLELTPYQVSIENGTSIL